MDSERIGSYDINTISYDAASKSITITGGIPIVINIKVSDLRIETQMLC